MKAHQYSILSVVLVIIHDTRGISNTLTIERYFYYLLFNDIRTLCLLCAYHICIYTMAITKLLNEVYISLKRYCKTLYLRVYFGICLKL